jgi:serine/threonine-protein kinase HipA
MVQEGNLHMSLAGAQEKIALHLDEAGNFYLPEGIAPSTIILKPANTSKKYPFAPANEWFCMTLARLSGLKAPLANVLSIGPHRVYVVKRYDRDVSSAGVRRLHQIDLCQAMNVPPRKKYEDEAGLSAKDLFSVAAQCRVPAVANSIAMRWLAFNYLIGNDDAHAKNISFLMATQKPEIAPAYDLLCVDAYHKVRRLTMGIGGQSQAGWVEGCHWDALALENRIDPRAMRTILAKLVAEVRKTKDVILASPVLEPAERAWLTVNVEPVLLERLAFIDTALAQPTCNARTILEKRDVIPEGILTRIGSFDTTARISS